MQIIKHIPVRLLPVTSWAQLPFEAGVWGTEDFNWLYSSAIDNRYPDKNGFEVAPHFTVRA